MARPRSSFQDNLVHPRRAEDIDMVARVCPSTRNRRYRSMGKLPRRKSACDTQRNGYFAHLHSGDFDPSWIPPRFFPPFYAHRTQAQQTHRPVSFSHLHSVLYLEQKCQFFPFDSGRDGPWDLYFRLNCCTPNQSNSFSSKACRADYAS